MVSRCDGLQDRQVGEWQRGQLQQLSLRLQLQHWRSVQPNRTSRSRPVSRVYHLINDLKLFQFLAPRYLLRLLYIGDVPHSRLVLKRKFLVKHRKFEKKRLFILFIYITLYIYLFIYPYEVSLHVKMLMKDANSCSLYFLFYLNSMIYSNVIDTFHWSRTLVLKSGSYSTLEMTHCFRNFLCKF